MFIDKSNFPFVKTLEDNWRLIREECCQLLEQEYDSWVQGAMYDSGWKIYGLVALNKPIAGHAENCPKTTEILSSIPGVTLAGFSRKAPGTIIKPHVGWAKSVYRLHLGLVVPQECAIRVEKDTRRWEEGQCLIFDDTVEHEAWNKSNGVRINLLLDFLRPGFESADRDMLPEEVLEYVEGLFKQS